MIDIEQDHSGAVWVGTFGGGIIRIDPERGEIQRFRHDPDDPGSLSTDIVRVVFEDSQRRLWIGTADGLNLFDAATETFERFHHADADPASLPDSDVMSIFEDRIGNLWFGTRAGGAGKWNPRTAELGYLRGDWLESAEVTSFATDGSDAVWIGTMGAGLKRFSLTDGSVEHYRHDPETPGGLSDDLVMSLLRDRGGTLWIGTMTGGLNRLDTGGRVTVFRHDPNDETTLGADGVMALMQDRAGAIWVGTYGGGVSRLDPESGVFERFDSDPSKPGSLSGSRATALAEHPSGAIWIGTDGAGLNRYNAGDGTFTVFRVDSANATGPSSDAIFSLHVDAQGRLWVGTAGEGLDRVDVPTASPDDMRFDNVAIVRERSGDTIYGIESDVAGRVWLSTSHGLAVVDPDTDSIRTFHREDGLQGEDFNFGAHHRADDGRLYFGGTEGFNAFDPMSIDDERNPIPVVLTGFEIANRPVATLTTVRTR